VRTIPSAIVTDGLVLWLDAGITPSYPGSGSTWTDISGNRNNGTLTNGPTYNNSNGGSIGFDGVDDYVTIPFNSDFAFGTGDFTVESWIYLTNTSKNYQMICGTHVGGAGGSGWYYYARNALQSNGAGKQSAGYVSDVQNSQAAITANTWIHMVIRRTSGTLTFYQNAIQGGSGAFTDNITNGSSFLIGNLNHPSLFPGIYAFGGNISIVRIYKSKGLTASEITQNFNAQKSRFGL
jgi:hypothetical protein